MGSKQVNVQDAYLDNLRKSKRPARVLLHNGKEVRGLVTGFDQFTLALRLKDTEILIYKSAVAIIDGETREAPASAPPGDEQC